MPRDASPRALGEITLPAGRKGRVVETTGAGQFVIITQSSWVERLHQAGHLDRDQHDAAAMLQDLFEASGVRPRLVGGCYDGGAAAVDGGCGDRLLETLSVKEMRAWRRLGRLLAAVPRQWRTIVTAVVIWDIEPWDVRALQRGLSALATQILHRSR